jgi:YidC/Oxa1 family membrane protein insertase
MIRVVSSRAVAAFPRSLLASGQAGISLPSADRGVRKVTSNNAAFLVPNVEAKFYQQNASLLTSITARNFSSGPENRNEINDTSASVDETLNRLFEDSQKQLTEGVTSTGDAWFAAAEQAPWDPTWYNLADQAILAVKSLHEFSGLEYGWSIVGVTVILRLCLFPVMVASQQTSSRMAHLQPELQQIKARYEALGTPSRQDQLQFSGQMKAIFAKYKVKPFRAFAGPVIQMPLFMGMFFGLRKMPSIFPEELSTGGMYWFTDLTASDPLYILPFTSALSFLALIELGKEQMVAQNAQSGHLMVNFFRVMSIGMVPVCVNFEAAMLCYWTSNNFMTLTQTAILKAPAARSYFGIWDAPKPVPGQEPESLTKAAEKLVKTVRGQATTERQEIAKHNKTVDAKKRAFQMVRASRTKRQGITDTKSN